MGIAAAAAQEGLSPRRSNLGAMSVSTEVQRTLVKSPPELWSELSNPEALARHLGDLGEIRIVAVEPETKVEWEANGASGVVHLKQSGWGTKVTLSVTQAAPADEEALAESEAVTEPGPAATEAVPEPVDEVEPESAAEPEPDPQPSATIEPEMFAAAEPEPDPEPELDHEPIIVIEPETVAATESEPVAEIEEPRVGFFTRLFRRLRTRQQESDAQLELKAATEPGPEMEVVALAAPEPIYPERPVEPEPQAAEPASDLAAELASVEAQMAQETTELLTGVLDRLGAAHHRPFSRG
jgi:hypothetical protein